MGLTGLAFVVASNGAAFAGYGAIAFDEQNCAWGRSWNYPSANEAAAVALKECNHSVCKVVIEIGPRQCGSLASTQNCKGWGAATRATLAQSQASALNDCAKANAGTECFARINNCNSD
jgi:hypothetical protein